MHPEPIYFCMPSRVLFAVGARRRIAPLCAAQGFKRALVVTDRFFHHHSPFIAELQRDLVAQGLTAAVYDGSEPDPSTTLCDAATNALAGGGFDHLIAVGGGSTIDLAKALTLTLRGPYSIERFVGPARWDVEPLPLVAVPTTAGTGSEITPGAILVQPARATKVAVMGNALRPRIAVVDPELTLSCPPKVTADAGLDAMTHAIETWLTQDASRFDLGGEPDPGYSGRNPLSQLLAQESVRLCWQHLLTAYRSPSDLHARTGMAYASLLAAMSYGSAGLHAVHGLAYALAGLTHATHGSTNAVFLPYVMDSLVHVRTAELARIARLGGAEPEGDARALARRAPLMVRELVQQLGIPTTLAGFGVEASQLEALARDALAVTRLAKAYPRGDAPEAYRAIIQAAYHGTLTGDLD